MIRRSSSAGRSTARAWYSLCRENETIHAGKVMTARVKWARWTPGVQRAHFTLAVITFPAWIVSFSLHKLYQARAVERPAEELRRIIYASLTAVGVMVAVSFILQFK